ncbi:MAG: hypothetical protein RX318_07575 [bacterium]|nr:hypothetical protein [bacterium]
MKMKVRFGGLVALMVCALVANSAHAAGESLEYKLATINAMRGFAKDDITVARFRSLLRQLSQTFVEDQQQIADMSVTVQQIMKEKGISESLLIIMEGMNQLVSSEVGNLKYAEYISAYATLRNKGDSHAQAIAGLQGILRAFGVY